MGLNKGILVALIVVLVIAIVYCCRGLLPGKLCGCESKSGFGCGCGCGGACKGKAEGFSQVNPYTIIQDKIGVIKGNPDAEDIFRSSNGWLAHEAATGADVKPRDVSRANRHMWLARPGSASRGKASATPEQRTEAERSMWFQARESDRGAPFNVEDMFEVGDDTMQAHKASPAIDYTQFTTDQVADKRTRENHMKWVNGMSGFSATTMKVDDLHDEDYINFTGLGRPQAGVGQYAPMQLTQIDDGMLARNKPFNFNG